jgi:hypothetical protein
MKQLMSKLNAEVVSIVPEVIRVSMYVGLGSFAQMALIFSSVIVGFIVQMRRPVSRAPRGVRAQWEVVNHSRC